MRDTVRGIWDRFYLAPTEQLRSLVPLVRLLKGDDAYTEPGS